MLLRAAAIALLPTRADTPSDAHAPLHSVLLARADAPHQLPRAQRADSQQRHMHDRAANQALDAGARNPVRQSVGQLAA